MMIKDIFLWLTIGIADKQYIQAIYSPRVNARSVAGKKRWSSAKARHAAKQDAMTLRLRKGDLGVDSQT